MTNRIERITLSEVTSAAVEAMRGQSVEACKAQVETSGTTLNLVSRMVRRYMAAERYADTKTDLVGVGVITFAQCRLAQFVNRCKARGIAFDCDNGAANAAWADNAPLPFPRG